MKDEKEDGRRSQEEMRSGFLILPRNHKPCLYFLGSPSTHPRLITLASRLFGSPVFDRSHSHFSFINSRAQTLDN